MKMQQCSKSEVKRMNAIFGELGLGEAPAIRTKRELDMIYRGRQISASVTSLPRREIGACGKSGYSSEGAALRIARARMNRGACRLRVYHCPDCKEWHLTHSVRERRRAFPASR